MWKTDASTRRRSVLDAGGDGRLGAGEALGFGLLVGHGQQPADEWLIGNLAKAMYGEMLPFTLEFVRIPGTGKRDALAHGFRAIARYNPGPHDTVSVIDGDSIVPDDLIERCAGFFLVDPKLGALTTDEVYAVTAYLLNMGEIIPEDFVLSDKTMAQAQARMPNRNGMVTKHGMWDVKGKPDVRSVACMKDCPVDARVASSLPDFARNAHGNLADQNRPVGAQRGAQTAGSAGSTAPASSAAPAAAGPAVPNDLLARNSCTACHAADRKMIGPSWADIAAKHAGKREYLAGKIKSGGPA